MSFGANRQHVSYHEAFSTFRSVCETDFMRYTYQCENRLIHSSLGSIENEPTFLSSPGANPRIDNGIFTFYTFVNFCFSLMYIELPMHCAAMRGDPKQCSHSSAMESEGSLMRHSTLTHNCLKSATATGLGLYLNAAMRYAKRVKQFQPMQNHVRRGTTKQICKAMHRKAM